MKLTTRYSARFAGEAFLEDNCLHYIIICPFKLNHICKMVKVKPNPGVKLAGLKEGRQEDLVKPTAKIASLSEWIDNVFKEYQQTTSNRLKAIDVYLLVILLTGAIQFLYCLLVGTFPFNSFLAGFISCVGSFIFGVCLRLQVDPTNKSMFGDISNERSFAEFLFAHLVLHLAVFNFIG